LLRRNDGALTRAGLSLENVVRLIYYTTDVEALIGAVGVVAERLGKALT